MIDPVDPEGTPPATAPLPDGTYDAFILDTSTHPDDDELLVGVDIAIVSGSHKGEMLSLSAHGVTGSPIDVLGMPATLVVTDGRPALTVDG